MASTPSEATCRWMAVLASRKASRVSRTSPGLSSTSSTSMGMPPPPIGLHDCAVASCQGKAKGRALSGLRLDRDAAAVPLDDLLADRQADAGAGELFPLVQPLEHAEDPFEVLRLDSQPVVLAPRTSTSLAAVPGRDETWTCGDSGALVLDGVADQVLKQLNQLHLVGQDAGQRIVRHHGAAVFDGAAQVHERLLPAPPRWRCRPAGPCLSSRRANRPAGPGSAAACGWPRPPRRR